MCAYYLLLCDMICNAIREYYGVTMTVQGLYLLSLSDDEDPTEDKALSKHISHESIPEGPQAAHPHPDTQEPQQTHLPLTGSIKTSL